MSNNNGHLLPRKDPKLSKTARIEAQAAQLSARIRGFEQEKSSMLATMACLVNRLGGQVIIGAADRKFLDDWLHDRVKLEVTESVADAAGHISFELKIVQAGEDEPKP